MKNKDKKKRAKETWTFQPDDDVVAAIEKKIGKELSRGERTKIINHALRLMHHEAAVLVAEQEYALVKAKRDALKGRAGGKG